MSQSFLTIYPIGAGRALHKIFIIVCGSCCKRHFYILDCIAPDGKWAYEGERVQAAEAAECMQCFCLRGAVRCQRLACAPSLRGCRPLLRHGECCPHQYQCEPRNNGILFFFINNITILLLPDSIFRCDCS